MWSWSSGTATGCGATSNLTRAARSISAGPGQAESLGLKPIPVYHPLLDGWDYFDELAAQYDRICFGNIVQAPAATRIRLLHTLWERHRRYPDRGFTSSA